MSEWENPVDKVFPPEWFIEHRRIQATMVYRELICTVCGNQTFGGYDCTDSMDELQNYYCRPCDAPRDKRWGIATWTKLDRSDIDVLL